MKKKSILDIPCRNSLHLTENERITLIEFISRYEADFFDFTKLRACREDYHTIQNILSYLENLDN